MKRDWLFVQEGAMKLTRRQREVAALIAAGKTNKEIAIALALSPGTVKEYISSALRDNGLANRTALAVAAQREAPQ